MDWSFSPVPNASSAHENVGKSETVAEARGTEIAGNACSEGSKSNAVASSVDTQLHVVNSTRELFVDNKKEQFRATEDGTGKNHNGIILILWET